MNDRAWVLSSSSATRRGFFARYHSWFHESCPGRAERDLEIARRGVRSYRAGPGTVTAKVPSSGGGWYSVALHWSGTRTPATPLGFAPVCACPDFRPWCKHAIALAYHVAEHN